MVTTLCRRHLQRTKERAVVVIHADFQTDLKRANKNNTTDHCKKQ